MGTGKAKYIRRRADTVSLCDLSKSERSVPLWNYGPPTHEKGGYTFFFQANPSKWDCRFIF